MKKVLILSASTGGGHNRAARAIAEELEQKKIECKIIDSLKLVNPTMDKIISKGYEKSAIYTPKAYGQMYKISDLKSSNLSLLTASMIHSIKKLILEENPSYIVGTHPFPLMAVSKLKEKGTINVPVMSILTDYTIHSSWIQNEIDEYIVGDEFVKQLLVEEGVYDNKIYSFGIPIEKSFLQPKDLSCIKEELNLENDKFTVLLMGGSFGAGNIKKAFLELLSIDKDFQIIVITGKNEHLKEKLEKILLDQSTNKNISILSFTDKISELFSISDVLITKPGGLTTTEAFLKELPMIIPYYIPGQEEENLDFLLNNGLALKTTSKYTLKVLIEIFINYPEKLQTIKENIHRIKKLYSSGENIANLIFDKINKNSLENAQVLNR